MQPEPMAAILGEYVETLRRRHRRRLLRQHARAYPRPRRARARAAACRRAPARRPAALASAVHSLALRQVPPPLLVGERVNATGSRAVKRLLLKDDYDGILQIAREQVEGGAHALDVSVALTERADESEQMRALVKKLQMGVEAPLIFDSTEADVLIAALKMYPGRAIVNSVNLENRAQRLDRVMPAVRGARRGGRGADDRRSGHGQDRGGQSADRGADRRDPERGVRSAARVDDRRHARLPDRDGRSRAGAARRSRPSTGSGAVKDALPGVLTILGVSNLSFGITPPARAVLNSVFLYHAVEAGLDLAIVNPAQITPYAEIPPEERDLADDLIFDRRPDALRAAISSTFERREPAAKRSRDDPTSTMTVEEQIHHQILQRRRDGIEALLDSRCARTIRFGF